MNKTNCKCKKVQEYATNVSVVIVTKSSTSSTVSNRPHDILFKKPVDDGKKYLIKTFSAASREVKPPPDGNKLNSLCKACRESRKMT